jgi:RNA polymerase sigma-70 factor (ECF subfamily)
MMQDQWLIWQFNRGRRESLHRIYERYKNALVTLAAALLTDRAAAEDVVHDVFIGFIQTAGKFRLTGSLKGYLSTCVANAARNRNKAHDRRRYADLDGIAPPLARNSDPEAGAILADDSGRVVRALAQLPYEQREVLVLRAYSDMKFAAIAAQQNTSIHTVQGRYRYALVKLRDILHDDANQEAEVAPHLKLRQG